MDNGRTSARPPSTVGKNGKLVIGKNSKKSTQANFWVYSSRV